MHPDVPPLAGGSFPKVQYYTPLSDGLTGVKLVGGCVVYVPYTHEVDVDELHKDLNQFALAQRVFEEDILRNEQDIAEKVYNWLDENDPQKQK